MAGIVWAIVLAVYAGASGAGQSSELDRLCEQRDRLEDEVKPEILDTLRAVRAEIIASAELVSLQQDIFAARQRIIDQLSMDEAICRARLRVKQAGEAISERAREKCDSAPVMIALRDRIADIEARLEELAFKRRQANFMLYEARRIARRDPRMIEAGVELRQLRRAVRANARDQQALKDLRVATKAFNELLVSIMRETEIGAQALATLEKTPEQVRGLRDELRGAREEMFAQKARLIREDPPLAKLCENLEKMKDELEEIRFRRTAEYRRDLLETQEKLAKELELKLGKDPRINILKRQRRDVSRRLSRIRQRVAQLESQQAQSPKTE